MQKLQLSKLKLPPVDKFLTDTMKQFGITRKMAKVQYNLLRGDEIWVNDIYQVNVDRNTLFHGMYPASITHISIKRRDKQPITGGWRHFQQIKNEVCGPEFEAFELYPRESRRVDTVNQYHLWVIPEGEMVSVGWMHRAVSGEASGNAVQTTFADDNERGE